MPLSAGFRNRVNTRYDTALVTIQTKQEVYLLNKGRYWQGIPTRNNPLAKPTDQEESWSDFGVDPVNPDVDLRIDTFDGPDGKGYTFTAEVTVQGEGTWRRSTTIGGLTPGDSGWIVIA